VRPDRTDDSHSRAAYWKEVRQIAWERSKKHWQAISLPVVSGGLVAAAITAFALGADKGMEQFFAVFVGMASGVIVGLCVYAVQWRYAVYEVHRLDVKDMIDLEKTVDSRLSAAHESTRQLAEEIQVLQDTIDATGKHKDLRVEYSGRSVIANGPDHIVALLWGVTVVNPNDYTVDVVPSLEMRTEGDYDISVDAEPWGADQLSNGPPNNEMERMILGQCLGAFIEIPAKRTKRGHLVFSLVTQMLMAMQRFHPNKSFRLYLVVRDKNTGVRGRRMVVLDRSSYPALNDFQRLPSGPSEAS